APGPGEQISVRDPVTFQRIDERPRYRLLADNVRKLLRPVAASQNGVRFARFSLLNSRFSILTHGARPEVRSSCAVSLVRTIENRKSKIQNQKKAPAAGLRTRLNHCTRVRCLWLHLPACPGSQLPFAWVPSRL